MPGLEVGVEALTHLPESHLLHAHLGAIFLDDQQFEPSERHFQQALAADSKHVKNIEIYKSLCKYNIYWDKSMVYMSW
jgi:hypothetical protein